MSTIRDEMVEYAETFAANVTPQGTRSMSMRDLTERLEKPLAEIPLLEATADTLRKLLSRLFFETPLRPLKNFLNGTWLEHPLHPVLTDIPIGGWTTALALDLAALLFGVKRIGKASAIATGVGTAGGVASVVTGLMDFMDLEKHDLVMARGHGASNLSATTIF